VGRLFCFVPYSWVYSRSTQATGLHLGGRFQIADRKMPPACSQVPPSPGPTPHTRPVSISASWILNGSANSLVCPRLLEILGGNEIGGFFASRRLHPARARRPTAGPDEDCLDIILGPGTRTSRGIPSNPALASPQHSPGKPGGLHVVCGVVCIVLCVCLCVCVHPDERTKRAAAVASSSSSTVPYRQPGTCLHGAESISRPASRWPRVLYVFLQSKLSLVRVQC
jgi:hypothetical protein